MFRLNLSDYIPPSAQREFIYLLAGILLVIAILYLLGVAYGRRKAEKEKLDWDMLEEEMKRKRNCKKGKA